MQKKLFHGCRCVCVRVSDYTFTLTLTTCCLQDSERKREIVNAMNDIQKVLDEMKKDPDDRNEFLMSFADRPDEFFGTSLQERRQTCCSIHNYCIFGHNVGECQCDKGISPWQKATECKPCLFHHEKSCCKCDRIAMTIGQDESVFHAYILGMHSHTTTHAHTHAHKYAHTHALTPQVTKLGMYRTKLACAKNPTVQDVMFRLLLDIVSGLVCASPTPLTF